MTPEHNMIDGTGNPPEEEGSAGTDTGAEGTLRPGPEGGEAGSSSPRPDAGGRTRGDEPQRPGDEDTDEERLQVEDDAREQESQVKELDERRERVAQAVEAMEAKLDGEKLSILQETDIVDVDKIVEVGMETGFTFDEFAAHLRMLGHSEDTIRELESRRALFRDDTEVDTDPDVMDVNKDSRDMIKKLVQAKESGNQEQIEAAVAEGEGFIDSIKKKLFDPGTGLLREEDRGKRLVVKPLVTMMLALVISYILALSVMTKGSTKRVGSG